ncbi:MAG TPA: hypothetical protein VK163_03355, partial [Opitutaceae bacterium]|nr:hypothetical protein [Opitutaceae bacterium]
SALGSRAETIRRALRQLQRGRASLENGDTTGGVAEAELGAQLAGALVPDPAGREPMRALLSELRGGKEVVALRQAAPRLIAEVEALLGKLQAQGDRDERVRRYDPDAIDPAYRPAVERYFERLSREEGKR